MKKWSQHVTETSDAMDVAKGTFKQKNPAKIAHAIERDAEKSKRRKSTPYRSAISMLTFYINRAGHNLPAAQRKVLEEAKEILRADYGKDAPKKKTAKKTAAKKPSAKTTSAKKKSATKSPASRKASRT